jgi:arylsulfatase A-like enzyme
MRAPPPTLPRNAVVVLLDSLNRHLLGAYGSGEFDTPNIDRLTARSIRFDRHVVGSLPCMPARHDILCGALDFLWRPWGSIEAWEEPITCELRRAGVTTMLVTDHPHLFETGGENYHTDFTAWDYLRGHENDPWRTRADPTWIGAPALPAVAHTAGMHYDTSRTWFRSEGDFPGPRTMAAAARWLEEQRPASGRFLLFVDEFDPHEPFDTPEPWASRYDPDWEGPRLIWPPYTKAGLAGGLLTERQARAVRAAYGAKLSMIDHWFGRLLDTLDRQSLWDDTMVILTTDHGHYLGERDMWGKPPAPLYEPMAHIPLLVAWPGAPAGRQDALTTSVDLHATLGEVFGVRAAHRTHGRSLVPLLTGAAASVREHALAGIWGREVHVHDGTRKYVRAPRQGNAPLSMWSNRWSTMPLNRPDAGRMPAPDGRAWLDRMPGSDVPVIRQPFSPGDRMPYWASGDFDGDLLYDVQDDPQETENRVGSSAEREAIDRLRAALDEVEAPKEQLQRLGIS